MPKANQKKGELRKPICRIAENVTPAMIARAEKQVAESPLRDEAKAVVPNCVADYHLVYRALAAFYAERAADVEGLISRSVEDMTAADISEAFAEPVRGEIPVAVEGHGDVWAEIDETKKMPVITLRVGSERARYRYNPAADKLSRMG